ncbi:cupin domain-containing protein [Belnapia sp. T6]|uniref:Cupin domain-containing protein n=1 Tax=Belnapia mucosa TaxID=2804532 RepID=A0ABS1V7E2_9PROT|nr:cupin domain-containing protein [Belnapia mucosa]MBL6457297.1 cupin domain-containing protein [Belnapia mucosa]
MDARDFAAILRAEGFDETLTRSLAAGTQVPEHTHPFDAKLLVTAGAFTLTMDGHAVTHGPGEVFSVPAGHRHAEAAGPEGADYLAGRRHRVG